MNKKYVNILTIDGYVFQFDNAKDTFDFISLWKKSADCFNGYFIDVKEKGQTGSNSKLLQGNKLKLNQE